MDEGDKDLEVATSFKSAVGDKTAEGRAASASTRRRSVFNVCGCEGG
jgi:hypothetical protein